ncbi:hypothetical protein TRAPUB_10748 [Trametes pubescens]|uniref:C2H2-type domain-containing protein n=1 Tax=Trametes pubescens TaxID=154538 RepID=A0A1M2VYW2_TRAPU|nr:hypothetical protein TRAPUB_10748 [Trametes pubescens]
MPEYYVDNDLCYCSLCDRYFPDEEVRANHVRYALNHPKCNKCELRFANGNALRVHYTISHRHNYCSACDRHFRSRAGLRAHVEFAAIHNGNDSDEEDEVDGIDDSYEGWEDDVGLQRFPDENYYIEPSVDDDEVLDESQHYWPEDDEADSLEDESYNGWAPVPSTVNVEDEPEDVTPSVEEADAKAHVCADSCGDAPCASAQKSKPPPPTAFVLNCPVCLDATSTPTSTTCGHIFCSS